MLSLATFCSLLLLTTANNLSHSTVAYVFKICKKYIKSENFNMRVRVKINLDFAIFSEFAEKTVPNGALLLYF